MSLQVIIPDDIAKKVQERSEATGTAPEAIVIGAVRETLSADDRLGEILGPVREAFAKSRMTEDELSDLLEEEKHAMRRGK